MVVDSLVYNPMLVIKYHPKFCSFYGYPLVQIVKKKTDFPNKNLICIQK